MSSEPGLAGGAAVEEPPRRRDYAEMSRHGLEAAFNHGDFSAVREMTRMGTAIPGYGTVRDAAGR